MTHGSAVPGTDAIRALAVRWLPALGDADFACSPAGLWLALGAVASGARGRTAEEFRELLGVGAEAAAEAVTSAGRRIAETGGLSVATGVWTRMPLLETWRRGLPDVRVGVLPGAAYLALPDEVFGATDDMSLGELPPDAQGDIDAWVREATGGRIARLPLELDGSEDLVLVNALALTVAWRTAFPRHLTRDEPFTDGHGETRPVPTMHRRLPAARAWRTAPGPGRVPGPDAAPATVVELPCAGETAARVRFVLGPVGAGPVEVLPAAWAEAGRRERIGADAVDLALPRFSLRTRTDVKRHLPALGVTLATRPEADFSGLSAAEPYLAEVAQEVRVEVAEEGVEAAAVTQVTMTRGAAQARRPVVERIAFDRPFGVVVLDATGEVPLFVGWRSGGQPTTRASSRPS